jgi:divalent metal cation (Fe/Co/Zn/Cd) transporter
VSSTIAIDRPRVLRRALRLEWVTVGWNVVEGVIAVWAAMLAGSVALLGFGLDSFVETFSGIVLLWRLLAEQRTPGDLAAVQRMERTAQRLVAASLVLLAAYVVADASWTLWQRTEPEPSLVGIVLTTVSLGVMRWLARAKRRVARALGSRAMESDAFQTTACWWLSLVTLTGMAVNGAFGWWWADPVAALGVAALVVVEARAAWRGGDCCGGCG